MFACSRPRNFFRSFSLGSHCCSVSARRVQFRARGRWQELAPRRPVGWAASVRSREGSRSGPAPTERAGPRRGRRDEIQGEAQAGGQGASDGLPRVLGRHGGAGAARRRAEARHRRLGEDATRRGLQSAQVRALASARAEQLATARSSAARFPPSFHAADARGTRANADNSRFSSQWRGTTDAREEFFAATRFLRGECALGGARGRAAERAGRRLNVHTARRRRAHPAHLLPIPDPYRHRGRTGVQLKDKWRNLIKFQHLRRGEAESAPYKGGARGAAPASAGKRKKGEDDRYASCKPRATEHHARGGRSGVARERRAAARRARGPRQFSRWRDGTHTAAARFPRRVRVSRAVSGFRGLAGQDDDVFFFSGKNANERRARLARDSPPIRASPPTPISHITAKPQPVERRKPLE